MKVDYYYIDITGFHICKSGEHKPVFAFKKKVFDSKSFEEVLK